MRLWPITLLFGLSLSCSGDDMPIADESRLIPIPDLREWYRKLNFSGRAELVTAGEPIFVTDPIYLADIYNPNDDPNATYLRQKAVVVSDFGGDTAAPVWWKPPFLVVSTSQHDQPEMPPGATQLAEQIGCDSASFVFIAVNDGIVKPLDWLVRVSYRSWWARQRNARLSGSLLVRSSSKCAIWPCFGCSSWWRA